MNSDYADRLELHAKNRTNFKGKRLKNRLRETFEPLAESPEDMFSLAFLFMCSCYGDPDYQKGAEFLCKAADGGIPDAMYLMAKCHYAAKAT